MFRQVVNKALRLSHVTSEQLCSFSTTSLKNRRSELNMVQLIGNVGQEPSLTERGHASFRIANHNSYKDKSDGIQTTTTWMTVLALKPGLTDIVMKYINKGDMLYVSGRLSSSYHQDEETQKHIESINLIANEIITIKTKVQDQNTAEPEELHEEEDNLPEESVENK